MILHILRLSILCLPLLLRAQSAPVLSLDAENIPGKLPQRFRTCEDPIKVKLEQPPSLKGLRELHISGSAQFSEDELSAILKKLPTDRKITVVDLRQESHGFINGIAVSWRIEKNLINLGKTLAEVEADEKSRLAEVRKEKEVSIYRTQPRAPQGKIIPESAMTVVVSSVMTERELCQKKNLSYLRVPVTDKRKPDDGQVDRFVTFAAAFPENEWIHFHCRAGSGRTTTFMAMYDMMHNAKDVPLCDIIIRQYLIHGRNLFDLPEESNWDYEQKKERKEFLTKFYEYCRQNAPAFKTSWSGWSAKH